MNKRLILIRHAHRDTSESRDIDNGLDEKGVKQAKRLLEYYLERFKNETPHLFSSRALRCIQTIEPLSRKFHVEMRVSPLLAEHWMDHKDESEEQFTARVELFLTQWKKSKALITIACSHGDWIPLALSQLINVQSDLKKGGWAEIEITDGTPKLTFLRQKLP